MIKWAWENVGAPGIYFGPEIQTEDESESSSTGEEPGPSHGSRGKGKEKASGLPSLHQLKAYIQAEEEASHQGKPCAWENVGAQGLYFGPDIEMDEEEERVMTAASRRSKDHLVGRPPVPPASINISWEGLRSPPSLHQHLVGRPPVPPQPPSTSRGKASGPPSLHQHLVGRPPVPPASINISWEGLRSPQPPSTSRGKASGPHSLKQQRPSTSRGKGKRRASCPSSLQPSAKRVCTTEEEEGGRGERWECSGDLRSGSSTLSMLVVGHEDTGKSTENLLNMSAPPIYWFLDHTPCFCIGRGVFFPASLSTLGSSRRRS